MYTPAAVCRMYPALRRSWWDGIAASAGVSRSVGKNMSVRCKVNMFRWETSGTACLARKGR